MKKKKIFRTVKIISTLLLITIFCSNIVIRNNAKGRVFNNVDQIPKNKVGLLLGTIKYFSDGRMNLYYQFRLEAAVSLFEAGKIDFILVSGDNGSVGYDEPTVFKDDLIAKGITEDKIYLDYAGFRTLDSVIRAKKVFGLDKITIISQPFHNERAIYLADQFKIDAIGYNAKKVSGKLSLKVTIREYLARVKVFLDIIFNKQPKFLGKKINIL